MLKASRTEYPSSISTKLRASLLAKSDVLTIQQITPNFILPCRYSCIIPKESFRIVRKHGLEKFNRYSEGGKWGKPTLGSLRWRDSRSQKHKEFAAEGDSGVELITWDWGRSWNRRSEERAEILDCYQASRWRFMLPADDQVLNILSFIHQRKAETKAIPGCHFSSRSHHNHCGRINEWQLLTRALPHLWRECQVL